MSRYLIDLSYLPLVVTSGGATADRWAPEDETLTKSISRRKFEVHRTPRASDLETSSRWRGRTERWLGLLLTVGASMGQAECEYRPPHVGRDTDLIYVWMQPYVSAEAGAGSRGVSASRGSPTSAIRGRSTR